MHNDTTANDPQGPFIKDKSKAPYFLLSLLIVVSASVATTIWSTHRHAARTGIVHVKGNHNSVILKSDGTHQTRVEAILHQDGGKLIDANGLTCSDYPKAAVCLHSEDVFAIKLKTSSPWRFIAGKPSKGDLETMDVLASGRVS